MIGCEFATIFSGFGQTRVELLNERKPRLLPSEDEDLSSLIERNLTRLGVTIHNGGELRDLDVAQDGALVDAYVETDGVMRKTHGPNEGFHKETGAVVLPFFVALLRQFETG